jgi:c-di-GMP-binding flagellar brake protein YcgR
VAMLERPDLILSARQRRVLRRAARVPCQVVAERGFRLVAERTVDLSMDGMLVRSDSEVSLGEEVLVALRMPSGRIWVDAQARVARIIEGRRRGDGGRALGIRFEEISNVDRALLGASLHGMPPPVPARQIRRDYATTVRLISLC